MCGIVGYGGGRQAYPILVKCLERAAEVKDVSGTVGIAHTRWATHGESCYN